MNAIKESQATYTLPFDIMKALAPIATHKEAKSRGGYIYGIAIKAKPESDGLTRFVATNGHCMLIIDYVFDGYTEGIAFIEGDEAKQYIASKGHYKPELDFCYAVDLPDYESVLPKNTCSIDEPIGFDPQYLAMLGKIGKALKLPTYRNQWMAEFSGPLSPVVWRLVHNPDVETGISDIQFVLMPVRID